MSPPVKYMYIFQIELTGEIVWIQQRVSVTCHRDMLFQRMCPFYLSVYLFIFLVLAKPTGGRCVV